jgi:hypothetical protein
MSNPYDDTEEDFEDTKADRQRRFKNKRKRDNRRDFQEQRIKPLKSTRPRSKIVWDPDYDDDDYEDYM